MTSLFSKEDIELMKKEIGSLDDLLPNFSIVFSRYWNYITKGKNPSLDYKLIKEIEEKIKGITQEDILRCKEYLLRLLREAPRLGSNWIEFMFPTFREFRKEHPIDPIGKIFDEFYSGFTTSDPTKHYLVSWWKDISNAITYKDKDQRVGIPLSQPIFHDHEKRTDLFLNERSVVLQIFKRTFDLKEENDPFLSGGEKVRWTLLNVGRNQLETNSFALEWYIAGIKAKSFQEKLLDYLTDQTWIIERLLQKFNLYYSFETIKFTTPIKEIIKGMKENKLIRKKNTKYPNLYQSDKSIWDQLREQNDVETFQVLANPSTTVHDLYLYYLENCDYFESEGNPPFSYRLREHFEPIIKTYFSENLESIKSLYLFFRVSGPLLTYQQELQAVLFGNFHLPSSYGTGTPITDQFDHPFIRLNDYDVVMTSHTHHSLLIEIPFKKLHNGTIGNLKEWIRGIPIIQDSHNRAIIDYEILDQFKDWRSQRIAEFEANEKISVLYPLLASNTFFDQLNDWIAIGNNIISEVTQVREALQTIIGTGKLDLPLLKSVLNEAYENTDQREFDRDTVLDLWARREKKISSSRNSVTYMISKIRNRLTKLIEFLNEHDDPDLLIRRVQQKKGAPRSLICLRGRDEKTNSSITGNLEVR